MYHKLTILFFMYSKLLICPMGRFCNFLCHSIKNKYVIIKFPFGFLLDSGHTNVLKIFNEKQYIVRGPTFFPTFLLSDIPYLYEWLFANFEKILQIFRFPLQHFSCLLRIYHSFFCLNFISIQSQFPTDIGNFFAHVFCYKKT